MKPDIYAAIACNLDSDILGAALPLFEAGKVEAIEWSFDALYHVEEIPGWFQQLLQAFSTEKRLVGHGVFFSLFSGKWLPEQKAWLETLRTFSKTFVFDHITEHFGYMTGKDFHKGAPLPIPYTPVTLAIGTDRLKRIQDACNCPVGLENLAFAYCTDDVKRQGDFLLKLVESVNGFIILDLHNVFCQTHNFNIPFKELVNLYPLHRVREIHISGGSWEPSAIETGVTIRRDTHDEGVPNEVFEYLETVIPICPNLKFVTMEQLGIGLKTEESRQQFQKDFERMRQIVASKKEHLHTAELLNDFLFPQNENILSDNPVENELLFQQQRQLVVILENAASVGDAQQQLQSSLLADSDWNTQNWNASMLETAIRIAQKWKKGWEV